MFVLVLDSADDTATLQISEAENIQPHLVLDLSPRGGLAPTVWRTTPRASFRIGASAYCRAQEELIHAHTDAHARTR